MWRIEERARRMEKACRPPKAAQGKDDQVGQQRLPGM
jgi:hypothetical protein